MKQVKLIMIIIEVIVSILVCLGLFNIIELGSVLPIALIYISILNISNGYSLYVSTKKRKGVLRILAGILYFIAGINMFFM